MYLKPTQALWNQIETKIDKMFEDRLKFASSWLNYGMNKATFDSKCIRSIISAEEDELVQQLGAKWFSTAEEIVVRIPNGVSHDVYHLPSKTGGRLPLLSPIWNQYTDATRPLVTNEDIKALAVRRREAIGKIITEKAAFKEQVKSTWFEAPSVNALAKIWPPIVDLLPPNIVQKLNEKTTRRTVKDMTEAVDTKALSVHILKAKIGE